MRYHPDPTSLPLKKWSSFSEEVILVKHQRKRMEGLAMKTSTGAEAAVFL